MKEYDFGYETFIGGWFIPENVCDEVIDYFNKNESKHTPGYVGRHGNVDERMKKAKEMFVEGNDKGTENYFDCLSKVISSYLQKYMDANMTESFTITEMAKIQHYKPGDGYYSWHMENNGKGTNRNRHLVFMTYLNNVEDGGGTDFKYQKITSPAKKGLTLIWPAAWTHTHKGQVSNTQEKYICTGWYNFHA